MASADSALGSIIRPRTWRRIRSRDDWRTSLLLLLALLVAIPGLHTILIGTEWVVQLGLVCSLVITVSAITRALSRRVFLPPIASAVAFVAVMTAFFEPDTAFLAIIPTADTMREFGGLLQQASISIDQQAVPATADTGITFVMCLGIAAISLAADAAALGIRAPALVGIPLVVLLAVPAYIAPGSTDPVTLVLSAIAFLLLLAVGGRRGQSRLTAVLGVSIVVFSLVGSFALPATVAQSSNDASGAFGTGVNPVLSLGSDLRQGENRMVLSYTTHSGDAQYLRLVSVVDFTGSNWAPDSFAADRKNSVDRIAAAPGLSTAVPAARDSASVRVATLTSRWLPLPYPTSRVSGLSGNWHWDTDGHAVSSTDHTASGQTYTATDLAIVPTAQQLLAAGSEVPAGLARYLVVPRGLPAVIAATARSVVGSATTEYEKAMLLQSYFHDGGFQYSETAPVSQGYDGTGGQVIATFLKTQAGYCIHFASAMAVMARTLGIPARISVGFLPGHVMSGTGAATRYEVDSHDLHAWPELYFSGVGWTRFEPTVSRGTVPSYAAGSSQTSPIPTSSSGADQRTSPGRSTAPVVPVSAAPTIGAIASSSRGAVAGVASWLWIVVVLVLTVLLSLLPAAVRAGRRRRSLASGSQLAAWAELLRSSTDVGRPMSDTLTPREVALQLRSCLDPTAAAALDRVVALLEHERFAGQQQQRGSSAHDIRTVSDSLFATLPPVERLLARLYPPSVWRGILPTGRRDQLTRTPGNR